jgi:hypothetical protein
MIISWLTKLHLLENNATYVRNVRFPMLYEMLQDLHMRHNSIQIPHDLFLEYVNDVLIDR